jgi:hypothetical protein
MKCAQFCALSVLIKRLCTLGIKCAQKALRVLKKWGLRALVLKQVLSGAHLCFLCTLRHTWVFFFIFSRKVCHFCHEHTVHSKFSFSTRCTLWQMPHYVDWLLPGPRWRRKGSNKLLFASRRSDDTRRRKTAGNIADGLRCCIWRRAEKPEKMAHQLVWGGKNQTGYIALLHPNALASRQPQYLAEHRLLSFLGKKICHFIHNFHPNWIARLGLPDSNGQHDQLVHHMQQRTVSSLSRLGPSSMWKGGVSTVTLTCLCTKIVTAVSLCFSVLTDSNELRDVECAMIDVFFDYAEGR